MANPALEERRAAADKIKSAPKRFKVCECCGSIVARKVDICPNCNAYRFNPDVSEVVRQADLLASREPLSIDFSDYE
jgi:recombinational DNA repair protein RecR